MDKVLLAIDGFTPNQGLFSYAVDLCRRMKSELSILQVIRPDDGARYLKNLRKIGAKARRAGTVFENAMMAATFAEANEHETAEKILKTARENLEPLLSGPAAKGVRVSMITRMGVPEREIPDYVNAHREVVITVCDSGAKAWENKTTPVNTDGNFTDPPLVSRIRRMLPVPLVVWRS